MSKNIGNILKQAQKMQSKIAQIQEEMAEKTTEASAGGGMVNAVANGRQELMSIAIEPEIVELKDIEMLQDLIVAAVNEALRKSKEMMAEEVGKFTSGLGLPGIL
ncbi:MAG: YbaB/EbfC family nucleoid-associated protein [Thermodesulfobacteriota bacterium]